MTVEYSWVFLANGGIVVICNVWGAVLKAMGAKGWPVTVGVLAVGIGLGALAMAKTSGDWGLGLLRGFLFACAALGLYHEAQKLTV